MSTNAPDVPLHFAFPFAFDAFGNVQVVAQDTPEEVATCVANIAVCGVGYRTDEPDFGIPDPLFQSLPLDLTGLTTAIEQWEPRAAVTAVGGDQLSTIVDQTPNGQVEMDYGGTNVTLYVQVQDGGD